MNILVLLFLTISLLTACDKNQHIDFSIINNGSELEEWTAQPNFSISDDKGLILSWVQTSSDNNSLHFSHFNNNSWTEPYKIADGVMSSWADLPSVKEINNNLWIAHWPVYQANSYGYDIALSISNDRGMSWKDPFKVNTDTTPAEHGFVSTFKANQGFGVIWIDGRDYYKDGEFKYVNEQGDILGSHLRFATFNNNGHRLSEEVIDNLVCDCCETDIIESNDINYLVYRNRSNLEIRDIQIKSFNNEIWSEPVTINEDNWQINACPINGPSIASKDNVLAVSWYDGSDDIGRILSKVSYDHGQSFQDLIIVDTNDVYGHTDIVITEDKQILVSWLGNENNDLVLKIKQISAKNDSDPFIVYRETGLGPSDFPKIEYYDNKLFIAWTSYDKTMQVKTKIIHLE